jgi:hypothetical protein
MIRQRILLVLGFALSVASFWPGMNVPVASQRALFDSLLTTAGIIFGVMGVWVALLYPQARDAVLKLGRAQTEEEKRVQRLIRPMLIATVVLGVVLAFGPVVEIVRAFSIAREYARELRGCSFALLISLTFLLFWSVFLTLLPMLWVQEDIEKVRRQKEAVAVLRQAQ